MDKYKVAYATGSRADYGIVRNYLRLLDEDSDIDFFVLVTGSHLEQKFGYSIDLIKNDGFKIGCEITLHLDNSSTAKILHSMSVAIESFGQYFEDNHLDMLIILGDRYEMMAVAIAAAMQKVPILHLHGGEITYGNYDEFIRHSITKMSQYHFTSTDTYRKRVIQLGESPNRVFCLGALGAENCKNIDETKVIKAVSKMAKKEYWVILFHPETLTDIDMTEQVREILSALEELNHDNQLVFIGTNADTNSGVIRDAWIRYTENHGRAYYFENLNTESFLWLVKNSIALIGNSSSGIIEVPSLGVYTVNVGDRQRGRVHGDSVIDVPCNKDEIVSAVHGAMKQLKEGNCFENLYYKEKTSLRYYLKTKELLLAGTSTLKEFYDIERY